MYIKTYIKWHKQGFFFLILKPQNTKKYKSGKGQAAALSYQQRFEVQHVLFSQDDEGSCATERVAPVGLQTRHPTQATLPVLTAKHTEAAPSPFSASAFSRKGWL